MLLFLSSLSLTSRISYTINRLNGKILSIRDITKDERANDDDIKIVFIFIWQMESTYKLPRSIYDFFLSLSSFIERGLCQLIAVSCDDDMKA